MDRVNLSVIIPTCNRKESLGRLLESISRMVVPESVVAEVIVVNNGSADGTGELLSEYAIRSPNFSVVPLTEQRKGKASALNQGLGDAKGDLILVLDDDVVVEPQLVVRHLEGYGRDGFDALQGRVLPGTYVDGKPADPERLIEYNIPLVDYGSEFREIRGLTGTNMSFRRRVVETIGGFDSRLGPGASGFSEDTEFSLRIRKAGFRIGYTPLAIVYHEINPARCGRGYNRDVEFRKGVSRSIYRHDSIVFRVIPDLLINCLRYGIYRIFGSSQKAYKAEGRIMKYWGYLMGKARRPESGESGTR